ncbi:hypothetical protein [Arthrobacter sp. CAN_A1]|uniref:hypothetical protein n=1 Tax=Arthrobacter sp. CAN_A1 TaxID=2787717 RepID=UPI0018CB3DF6
MEALWIILALLVAAGVGWPVTTGVLKLARTVDEHEKTAEHHQAAQDWAEQDNAPQDRAEHQSRREPAETSGLPADDARPRIVIPDPPTHDPTTSAKPASRPGVLRGGLVIGVLERLAVAGAILANEPVAIAYVVAIKGLGRYAELKDTPAVAERFIIGTLTSMLWAAAVAGFTAAYLL